MRRLLSLSLLLAVASLNACASIPSGPSVMSLPGSGKTFDQFRADDAACRQYAQEQVGGTTAQSAGQGAATSSAVIGTILGAAAGAAIGSASGDMGSGAAIGAGTGLLFGSAAGMGYAYESFSEVQRRYDHAYIQCMYALGNKVPVYGQFTEPAPAKREPPPPPAKYPPPPPSPGQ